MYARPTDSYAHAIGVDIYNLEITGETACSVTAATGICNATGPKALVEIGSQIAYPVALRNRGGGKEIEMREDDKANSLTTVQTDSMVFTLRIRCGCDGGAKEP